MPLVSPETSEAKCIRVSDPKDCVLNVYIGQPMDRIRWPAKP